jgi:hypothetical protein
MGQHTLLTRRVKALQISADLILKKMSELEKQLSWLTTLNLPIG